MKTEQIHTLILGAGPAGLAAGYTLAKAGLKPVIVEKDKVCGGLMRSLRRGPFIMDIGRKELYNRLEKVDAFWEKILGQDYRRYPHRGGLLYEGHIIDLSPAYRGFRRGMPWPMLLGCGADFLWNRLASAGAKPRNVEEYFYRQRGRRLTRAVSQGFQEKLTGTKWAEIPLQADSQTNGPGFFATVKAALERTFSKTEPNTFKGNWRHPAKGTGQICEFMERGIRESGGRILTESKILRMSHAGDKLQTVEVQTPSETVALAPAHLISSVPLELLVQYLKPDRFQSGSGQAPPATFRRKTVVLVYLFLDEKPQFPHAWLNVTCPTTRIGRVTNYAALEGEMVPEGKTCLCCEYYCFDEDSFLKQTDQAIVELTLKEGQRFRLLDPAKCFDNLVLRIPGADASQNRHNWLGKIRLGLLEEINTFKNIYYANRTDLDIATLAGIESAEAIMAGDRSTFDRHIDPRELGIRSERKAFEFKNPAAQ
jgi:protoporphyrinogen oxidase